MSFTMNFLQFKVKQPSSECPLFPNSLPPHTDIHSLWDKSEQSWKKTGCMEELLGQSEEPRGYFQDTAQSSVPQSVSNITDILQVTSSPIASLCHLAPIFSIPTVYQPQLLQLQMFLPFSPMSRHEGQWREKWMAFRSRRSYQMMGQKLQS